MWCVSGPVCGRSVALGAVLTVAALLIAAAGAALGTAQMARADQHDVEITAALVNAGQGREDRSYEWVLLTNLGEAGVELNGWTLADNSSSDALGDRVLGADETLLVVAACSALIGAPASDWDDVLADAAIGGGLANRGDLVELRDADGELIDAVSWGDVETHGVREAGEAGVPLRFGEAEVAEARSGERPVVIGLGSATLDAASGAGIVQLVNRCEWDEALDGWSVANGEGEVELNGLQVPAEGGVELEIEAGDREAPVELRSPAGAVVAATRWVASASAGAVTAAVVEPVVAAEAEARVESSATIRIVEIMPRPLAGEAEWVELLNEGDAAVDLSEWRIGDERSTRGLWGTLEAGARVVFAAGALSGVEGDVRVLDGRIGNGLNNDRDVVQLIGPDGTLVDLVEYGTGALPAPAAGASLALSPRVWVVNETPTPAGERVTPALGAVDVVLEASEASPVAGLPVSQLETGGGLNPWMVVSAGLVGLIAALLLRRWAPGGRATEEPPPLPEGPPPWDASLDYAQSEVNEPEGGAVAEAEQSHPWDEEEA